MTELVKSLNGRITAEIGVPEEKGARIGMTGILIYPSDGEHDGLVIELKDNGWFSLAKIATNGEITKLEVNEA